MQQKAKELVTRRLFTKSDDFLRLELWIRSGIKFRLCLEDRQAVSKARIRRNYRLRPKYLGYFRQAYS